MFENNFAYPKQYGEKWGNTFLWVGVLENGKYFFTLLFKHLTNVCLFLLRSQGWIFVKLSMKLMKFFGKKSFLFHQKKRKFIFCCFVLFLFCILRSRFSFITYEITARFLLILILEVKLRNCFFFHQDFIFTCGLFRTFWGLFRGLQGL